MNTATKTELQEIALQAATRPQSFDLSPQTFEQALTFAQYLSDSDMVPKDFKGKPGNCLIAMQWGMEIGLKPLQAMQNIAVINGRPSLWGDAVIGLARNSALCEYIIESDNETSATCTVKRRGEQEQSRTFSIQDAKTAGLWGKAGPWTQYPKRMLQMRARGFAIRDVFADVLKGLAIAEESMDTPVIQHEPREPRKMGDVERLDAPSDALLKAAYEAAAKGVSDYQAYWKSIGADGRKALHDLHASLKQTAIDADKGQPAAPVIDPADNPEAGADSKPTTDAPKVTYAIVMEKLIKAKNMDALDVAADWIGEVADPAQRSELSAKYEEFKAALESKS